MCGMKLKRYYMNKHAVIMLLNEHSNKILLMTHNTSKEYMIQPLSEKFLLAVEGNSHRAITVQCADCERFGSTQHLK